jgi:septal ring factor EnvC (AmiA/AmiB activator)
LKSLTLAMTKSLAIIAFMLALTEPASAEIFSAPPKPAPGLELNTMERALERSEFRQQSLIGAAAALTREQYELSRQLIATAAEIQAREAMINASREKIAVLGREEAVLRRNLSHRSDQLAELLAGLTELEKNPPPALLASPRDALSAVRAAMLFGAAVPALRSETAALSRDLARLASLRSTIIREQQALSANLEKLRFAKLDLESLYDRKNVLLAATDDALLKERERAAKLAQKAKTLKQLVEALAEDGSRRREHAAKQAALRSPEATEKPPLAFTERLGRLDYPAQGQLIRQFGDADGFGGQAKGIFIATTTEAQVVSPAVGRIAFAGNFRSYGQLLILDVGEGYHVLLAGMARVKVETGQSIEAGEPVGEMGDAPAQGTIIGGQLEDPRPVIYIEFRKAGSAIDPSRWWIGANREALSQKGMN